MSGPHLEKFVLVQLPSNSTFWNWMFCYGIQRILTLVHAMVWIIPVQNLAVFPLRYSLILVSYLCVGLPLFLLV
jgi:hypothetical protein